MNTTQKNNLNGLNQFIDYPDNNYGYFRNNQNDYINNKEGLYYNEYPNSKKNYDTNFNNENIGYSNFSDRNMLGNQQGYANVTLTKSILKEINLKNKICLLSKLNKTHNLFNINNILKKKPFMCFSS
jgi:hypothetical protein